MPPALESLIKESPVVAGLVAVVALVFALALLAAIVSGLRGRRRRDAIRREPRLYGVTDDDEDMPAYADAPAAVGAEAPSRAPMRPAAARPPRRGFGFAALVIAFVLGLLGGMAAMLTSRQEIADGLARLSALVSPAPTERSAAPVAPAAVPLAAAAEATGPAADVGARLAAFATSLEASLPRQAGPDLSLERVSVEGSTLNLQYAVARVLPPEEVPPFRAYIDRTVRSLFCAEEAREIRYLSRNGVLFHMTYADSSGASLSELTVTPEYCG